MGATPNDTNAPDAATNHQIYVYDGTPDESRIEEESTDNILQREENKENEIVNCSDLDSEDVVTSTAPWS